MVGLCLNCWTQCKPAKRRYLKVNLMLKFQLASPLVAGLKSCEAVRVDGEWFSLDPTYHMKVVGFIFRWLIACM